MSWGVVNDNFNQPSILRGVSVSYVVSVLSVQHHDFDVRATAILVLRKKVLLSGVVKVGDW